MASIMATNENNKPTVLVVTYPPVGPYPVPMICPVCQTDIVTRLAIISTVKTHLMFGLCCIFCCWLCAPCVYRCSDCSAKEHYCPNCNSFLGIYDA